MNATSCLAIGLTAGWFACRGESGDQTVRLFLATGILAGFNTFSALSRAAALLWERGDVILTGVYVAGSVVLALLGVFAGLAIMRMVLQ